MDQGDDEYPGFGEICPSFPESSQQGKNRDDDSQHSEWIRAHDDDDE